MMAQTQVQKVDTHAMRACTDTQRERERDRERTYDIKGHPQTPSNV